MRLFVDTNVMLDLLGERMPYYKAAAKIATLSDRGEVHLFVSALSYATVNYFLEKYVGRSEAKEKLKGFKIISEIANINDSIIEKALYSNFKDFEDALQYFNALESQCDIIIARNGKDFKLSEIPVMTAEEYLAGMHKR